MLVRLTETAVKVAFNLHVPKCMEPLEKIALNFSYHVDTKNTRDNFRVD